MRSGTGILNEMADCIPKSHEIKTLHKPTVEALYRKGFINEETYQDLKYFMRIKSIKESVGGPGMDKETVLDLYKSGSLDKDKTEKLMKQPDGQPAASVSATPGAPVTEDDEELEKEEDKEELLTEAWSDFLSKHNMGAEQLGAIISDLKKGKGVRSVADDFNIDRKVVVDIAMTIARDRINYLSDNYGAED